MDQNNVVLKDDLRNYCGFSFLSYDSGLIWYLQENIIFEINVDDNDKVQDHFHLPVWKAWIIILEIKIELNVKHFISLSSSSIQGRI